MSDSDGDYDFNLGGNHAAVKKHTPGMRDLTNPPVQDQLEDLDYGRNDFGKPQENDLEIEDDWNTGGFNYDQPSVNKNKTKQQELIDKQKSHLTKKNFTANDNNIDYNYRKNYDKGPGLDDYYENQLKPKIQQYDAQLEGEIQHESLKENLDKQKQNRVEFVAESPAELLRKQKDPDYGKVNMVDMDSAQVETGNYNDEEKPKKRKKKKKKKKDVVVEETTEDPSEAESGAYPSTQLVDEEPVNNHRRIEEYDVDGAVDDQQVLSNEGEGERPKKKKKKKKKSGYMEEEEDKIDSNDVPHSAPGEEYPEGEEEEGFGVHPGDAPEPESVDSEPKKKKKKKDRQSKKEKKNKKKEEILRIKNEFMEKLISPFTEVDELVKMFMQPLPKEVGILECTIQRNKSGFNYWNPKYTLVLSEGERFLLNGKKRGGNKTSNYLITLDQGNLKKKGEGYLGKLRANFMGTEFVIYDQGENPKKTKNTDMMRRELASVLYESNVLGSKGPRKMRVLIPAIDKEDNI